MVNAHTTPAFQATSKLGSTSMSRKSWRMGGEQICYSGGTNRSTVKLQCKFWQSWWIRFSATNASRLYPYRSHILPANRVGSQWPTYNKPYITYKESITEGGYHSRWERDLGTKENVVLSRCVCGGFCRRTWSPHTIAALSNSRMHSLPLPNRPKSISGHGNIESREDFRDGWSSRLPQTNNHPTAKWKKYVG